MTGIILNLILPYENKIKVIKKAGIPNYGSAHFLLSKNPAAFPFMPFSSSLFHFIRHAFHRLFILKFTNFTLVRHQHLAHIWHSCTSELTVRHALSSFLQGQTHPFLPYLAYFLGRLFGLIPFASSFVHIPDIAPTMSCLAWLKVLDEFIDFDKCGFPVRPTATLGFNKSGFHVLQVS